MSEVIFDCDDICFEFAPGFSEYLLKYHGVITRGSLPSKWDMVEWSGLPQERILEILVEFSTSKYFGELKPIPGAVEGIMQLVDAGYNPVIVTACFKHELTELRRRQNVDAVFGAGTFSRIDFTPMGTSKLAQLSQYEPTIFVEDNYHNALAGIEAGHEVLIRRVPHNLEYRDNSPSEMTWFDSFPEVVSHIFDRKPLVDMNGVHYA